MIHFKAWIWTWILEGKLIAWSKALFHLNPKTISIQKSVHSFIQYHLHGSYKKLQKKKNTKLTYNWLLVNYRLFGKPVDRSQLTYSNDLTLMPAWIPYHFPSFHVIPLSSSFMNKKTIFVPSLVCLQMAMPWNHVMPSPRPAMHYQHAI